MRDAAHAADAKVIAKATPREERRRREHWIYRQARERKCLKKGNSKDDCYRPGPYSTTTQESWYANGRLQSHAALPRCAQVILLYSQEVYDRRRQFCDGVTVLEVDATHRMQRARNKCRKTPQLSNAMRLWYAVGHIARSKAPETAVQ